MIKLYLQYTLVTVSILLFLSSCGTTRRISDLPLTDSKHCTKALEKTFGSYRPKSFDEESIHERLHDTYSDESLHIAHAIDILDELKELDSLQRLDSTSLEIRVKELELINYITNTIYISSFEIESLAAALGCEEERASQIADYLERQESQRDRRLTAAAISMSALSSISTGVFLFLPPSYWDDIIGISTGIIGGSLSVRSMMIDSKVRFEHPDNLLEEIWSGPDYSTLFPPSVWYYFTEPFFSALESNTIRESLIKRWKEFQALSPAGSSDEEYEKLFFAEGGVYTTSQLRTRADMLDQTELEVNLMLNHLQRLLREFFNTTKQK